MILPANPDKNIPLQKLIEQFSHYVKEHYGTELHVFRYHGRHNNLNGLKLDQLIEILNQHPDLKGTGLTLRSHSRKRLLVDIKKVYSKIASDMGFHLTLIGEKIGNDYTTIIHHRDDCTMLLETDVSFNTFFFNTIDIITKNPVFKDEPSIKVYYLSRLVA